MILIHCCSNFAHLTGSRVLLRVVRRGISLQLHDDHNDDEHSESGCLQLHSEGRACAQRPICSAQRERTRRIQRLLGGRHAADGVGDGRDTVLPRSSVWCDSQGLHILEVYTL